jgi:crotonobetainyl-CoA:carnitine CoA-transferase CaiB-like acyl-CoA transferase
MVPLNWCCWPLPHPLEIVERMVQTLRDPRGGEFRLVGPALKLGATPPTIRSAPPSLGQHTAKVLHEMLGYDDQQIAQLKASGAIAVPDD